MILCLCLASSYRVNGTRIISKEEDLELERQLKLINKPPIKSIQVLEYIFSQKKKTVVEYISHIHVRYNLQIFIFVIEIAILHIYLV